MYVDDSAAIGSSRCNVTLASAYTWCLTLVVYIYISIDHFDYSYLEIFHIYHGRAAFSFFFCVNRRLEKSLIDSISINTVKKEVVNDWHGCHVGTETDLISGLV